MHLIASAPCVSRGSGRPWKRLQEALRASGAQFELSITNCVGHATVLARESRSHRVVAVGGDGTLSEVLNGVLQSAREARPSVGLLPLGTGNDFARTARIPLAAKDAVRHLLAAVPRPLDVIRFSCEGRQGYCVNVASIGFAAEVADHMTRYSRGAGGTLPYLRALVRCLRGWRNSMMSVEVDGERRQGMTFTVNVANARHYGGGMFAAPRAVLDDGLLDVVTIAGLRPLEIFRYMPNNYSGRFDSIEKIQMLQGRRVTVAAPEPLRVQVDGDLVGSTPATFEIVPGEVQFLF